jgi:hypothetical protein
MIGNPLLLDGNKVSTLFHNDSHYVNLKDVASICAWMEADGAGNQITYLDTDGRKTTMDCVIVDGTSDFSVRGYGIHFTNETGADEYWVPVREFFETAGMHIKTNMMTNTITVVKPTNENLPLADDNYYKDVFGEYHGATAPTETEVTAPSEDQEQELIEKYADAGTTSMLLYVERESNELYRLGLMDKEGTVVCVTFMEPVIPEVSDDITIEDVDPEVFNNRLAAVVSMLDIEVVIDVEPPVPETEPADAATSSTGPETETSIPVETKLPKETEQPTNSATSPVSEPTAPPEGAGPATEG